MEENLEFWKGIQEILETNDPVKTQACYSDIANKYDLSLSVFGYNGPNLFIGCFLKQNFPKSIRILEIGAGTGLLGALLYQNGYTNIDANDANKELLEKAKEKECYKNFINCFVSKDESLPIEDNTYDVIVAVGCLGPGHIKWDSFPQIIRITKPGGIIMFMDGLPNAYSYDKEYGNGENEKVVESLCAQHEWKHLPGFPKLVENYFKNEDGIVYAMRILGKEGPQL